MNFPIEENVSLAELTTLKIGGRARWFARATSEREIIAALEYADQNKLAVFVLGGGSNVLIADAGFDGLVLQIALKGLSVVEGKDETVFVTAQAGEDWDALCEFCAARNLQGIECLSGIPGFTGGTPVQNVGAYGQEVSETICRVKCYDRKAKKIVEMNNAECGFAYRTSVFNTTEKNRYIVTAVTFALKFSGAPKIVYRDLINYFGGAAPDLLETRRAVLKIRGAKSMVVAADDPNSQSAGSFFKNPMVSVEKFAEINERATRLGFESVPHFATDENKVKIPAAWLIEKSGFRQGFEFGRAGLSTNHTLAIINRGGATAEDVLNLKNLIQATVKEKFGVELKPEPIFVGFAGD